MGLVTILVFLGLLGELRTTPIKFLFDVDPSEISGRVAPSPSNPGRQTRRLSSMVRSEAGHNGAELVRGRNQQPVESNPRSDGKRCVDKVEMVEVTEYDDVVQCDHSYDKRCHTTYVTNYLGQQVEECEENFLKSCYIEYDKIAFNETVEICRTPLVKDCEVQGPEICRTEYESECWTKQEVHDVEDDVVECRTEVEEKCEDETSGYTTNTKCSKWPREVCSVKKKNVKKFTPVTECRKEPRQLCAPAGCGFTEGSPECQEVVKTVVQDKPSESCQLQPRRRCQVVTKLVPKLEPQEECLEVPREVCTTSRQNQRTVKKPLTKKWCYVPSK